MKANQASMIFLAIFAGGTFQAFASDLMINHSGEEVSLSWPLSSTNDYYLQTTTNLSIQTLWMNAIDPITNETSWVVTDGATNSSCFFRLKEWETLFDGTSTDAFRGYRQPDFPSTNYWVVTTNSELMSVSNATPVELITRSQYGSYELRWEWKSSVQGNSGIHYRATETYEYSGSAGPEYQLIDDSGYSSLPAKRSMGASYGLFAPSNKTLMPVGQWNDCRLILQGNHVQHWLNGNLVLEYEINSLAWTNALASAAAHQNVESFGQGTSPGIGHIILRNDTAPVWYRNIKLRPLPSE